MTETPQFNSFTTQPLDSLAQQQPSQGQLHQKLNLLTYRDLLTLFLLHVFLTRKNLRALLLSLLSLHSVSRCISSGIHPHQQTRLPLSPSKISAELPQTAVLTQAVL